MNELKQVSNKKGTAIILITSIAVFILFPLLTEMFATELREISSIITEKIISILGMDITRNGTILSFDTMSFDVIPACDGSTTLRTLFTLSILLVYLKSELFIPGKIVCLILSIPIALFTNGIRLSLLFIISSIKGYEISGGFLHTMIGVFSFILAILAMIALIDLLSTKQASQKEKNIQSSEIIILSIILLILVHSSFIFSCFKNWRGTSYNINDMYGYLFFIPAAAIYIISWIKWKQNSQSSKYAFILFVLIIIIAAFSQIPGRNNYVLGCTFLVTILLLGAIDKGWNFAFKTILLLFIMFLSFPKTTEFIYDITRVRNFHIALIIKLVISILLLIIYYYSFKMTYRKQITSNSNGIKPKHKLVSLIILITLLIMFKSYFLDNSNEENISQNIHINYIMNNWIGTDIYDRNVEKFYHNYPLINRSYTNGNSAVGLMVIASKGNRQNIHTPEYCQYPLGWKVESKSYYNFHTSKGYKIRANRLVLINGNMKRNFLYWFDNNLETTSTYYGFILADILQNFLGNKTNWYLYVVWSDDSCDEVKSFLKSFSR